MSLIFTRKLKKSGKDKEKNVQLFLIELSDICFKLEKPILYGCIYALIL